MANVNLNRMGPTDRSLMAAQKALAEYRNTRPASVEKAMKLAEKQMARKLFIHSSKSPAAGHELTVTFRLRNIVSYGGKYTATATFSFLAGIESERKKGNVTKGLKKFRESVAHDLTYTTTTMFKEFWARCQITCTDGTAKPAATDDVKEKFRSYIIKQMSDTSSVMYNQFDKAVVVRPRK